MPSTAYVTVVQSRCCSLSSFLLLLILVVCTPASAGTIQGTVKNMQDRPVSSADVILHNTMDRNSKPLAEKTDSKGHFRFDVKDISQIYKLIAVSKGNIGQMLIDYRGQTEEFDVRVGRRWHESHIFVALESITKFLVPFFLGLFSREIAGVLKKRKNKKYILSIYKKSLEKFLNQYQAIGKDASYSERLYKDLYEDFSSLKNSLETLLSYAWAVENMDPLFFERMQERLYVVKAMERTIPFNPKLGYEDKLIFLRKHHSQERLADQKEEHQEFAKPLGFFQQDLTNL